MYLWGNLRGCLATQIMQVSIQVQLVTWQYLWLDSTCDYLQDYFDQYVTHSDKD